MSARSLIQALGAMTVAILLLAANLAASAPNPTDTESFTAHVADAIAKRLPDAKVTIKGPLTLEVTRNEASLEVRLDNLASDCAREPQDCDQAIANFLSVITAALLERDAPIRKSDIRAVLRTTDYVNELRGQATDKSKGMPIVRQVIADLWLVCVVDRPKNIVSLSTDRAAKLGLSEDEAVAVAKANSKAALRPFSAVFRDLPPNGIGYIDGDFYESSRFLLHDDWAPLSAKLNGNLVVAVPATDLIVYGNGKDIRGLDAIATLAAHLAEKAPRRLSSALFRWTPSGWETVAR